MATEELVRRLLENLGEDPAREGLLRTPERVARSLAELTQGRVQTVEDAVGQGVFQINAKTPTRAKAPPETLFRARALLGRSRVQNAHR